MITTVYRLERRDHCFRTGSNSFFRLKTPVNVHSHHSLLSRFQTFLASRWRRQRICCSGNSQQRIARVVHDYFRSKEKRMQLLFLFLSAILCLINADCPSPTPVIELPEVECPAGVKGDPCVAGSSCLCSFPFLCTQGKCGELVWGGKGQREMQFRSRLPERRIFEQL